MFERFTDRARKVLTLAQEEAGRLNHSFIGTEHILLGLLHEGEGVGAKALESLDISLDAVREKVEETIGMAATAPSGSPPFTPRAKKVLELSLREALQLGHSYIGTEHLLLGLVREGDGVACRVLVGLGTDLGAVRQKVLQLMEGYSGKETAAIGGVQRLRKRPWSRRPETGMTTAHEGVEVRAASRPALPASDRCALCDRDLWEAAHYVAVGRWQICDTCIRSSADVLERAAPEPRRLSLPPRVFGDAPDDEAGAVVAAVDAAFGSGRSSEDRAGAVEDHASLEPALRQVADLYPVPASIRVSRVRFTSTDAADVRFHLAILGTEPSFDGQVRRRDGRWVLTRRTVVEVLRWAGVDVPPPSPTGPSREGQ